MSLENPNAEKRGSEDPVVSVSMSKGLWEALLSVEPLAKETYTDEGLSVFSAFQQIHQQTGIEGHS